MNHGKGLEGALQATEEVCRENLRAEGREDLIKELDDAKEKAKQMRLIF